MSISRVAREMQHTGPRQFRMSSSVSLEIVSTIVNRVRSSSGHFFSIIADEIQDCSNSE